VHSWCGCVRVCERERICVCVCDSYMCDEARQSHALMVCVCVGVGERERESVCVCDIYVWMRRGGYARSWFVCVCV